MEGSRFYVLDLLFFSSLWLVWLEYDTYAHQDGCRRVKFIPPETGKYLVGHVIMNLTTGMYTPCEHRCVMERKCVSVNIGPSIEDKVICELSDSDHLQHPEDLKIRPGWTYRGTENLCCSNPCLNNATCLMGYTDKRYRCECTLGFSGENCEKDIDECSNGTHDCNRNASCTNTRGAFYCTCRAGYTGDGHSCSDCTSNLHHFEKYQDLPTRGTFAVEQFNIDGILFLAFANYYGDIERYNTDSFIYKLDDSTGKFTLHQTIDTTGANYMEYFTIADKHYLAVANHNNGATYKLNSTIYQWNGHQFQFFQNIPTLGAISFNFFKILPHLFLAVTNYYNDTSYSVNSVIYKWKDNHFEKFQVIATEGAFSSTPFVIDNEHFIAFANQPVYSHLYKWSGESFIKLQSIPTSRAYDVKSFRINADTFIVFTSWTGVFMYKWNGTTFAPFQSFLTGWWVPSAHSFVMCGQPYLGVTMHSKGTLVVYGFSESKFVKYQEVVTRKSWDLTSFEYKGYTYLAVANHQGLSGNYSINSTIYILV